MEAPLSYTISTLPGNAKYLLLYDTTYGLQLPAAAASAQAPGTLRKRWARHRRVSITIKNGDQAVTVVFQAVTDSTLATSSAYATDTATGPGGGSVTLAASTTQTYNWLLPTPDSRVYVLSGGTGPATFSATVTAFTDATPGQ